MEVLITVLRDYDGFFERITKEIMSEVNNTKIKEVQIDSGPWRAYEISYSFKEKTGVLYLDWYSACRNPLIGRSTTNSELIEEFNKL